MIDVELDGNHKRILKSYGHCIICPKEITKEKAFEMAEWSVDNIGYKILTSQVHIMGHCPYWVFYFHEEYEAMAFKLRWQ